MTHPVFSAATPHRVPRRLLASLLALAAVAAAAAWLPSPAQAQAAPADAAAKSVGAEPVPVVPAFDQWINSVVLVTPVPSQPTVTTVIVVPIVPGSITAPAPALPPTAGDWQPHPVILGLPELPLLGAAARQPISAWAPNFNYQGMHVRLLVLDASGRRFEVRPVGAPVKPGERFKLRVSTTFPAVADVGLVVGEAWANRRAGQIFPAAGLSVQMNAGESTDLPLEPGQYFVMGNVPTERLLLSVRHARAVGDARSSQPAYRQDGRNGSSFLQLVPGGSFPAIEQLLALDAR